MPATVISAKLKKILKEHDSLDRSERNLLAKLASRDFSTMKSQELVKIFSLLDKEIIRNGKFIKSLSDFMK